MAGGTVIEEFLISIRYDKVDDKPLKDASAAAKDTADKAKERWEKAAKAISSSLMAVGAAALGATGGLFKLAQSAAASGREIDTWSRKLGVSARELQRLEFAGAQTGAEVDNVREAVKTLRENLGEMERVGSGPAVDSLKTLGITLGEIKNLNAEDQLALIGQRLQALPNHAQRVSVALELMGEDGGALLPLFQEGAGAIERYGDQAERLGLVMGDDAVEAAKKFDTQLTQLKGQLGAMARNIGVELIPVVQQMIRDWDKWALAIGGLGVALGGLKLAMLPGQLGLASNGMAALALKTAGAATAAAALGFALGTALDNALGISDALADVNGVTTQRGGVRFLGEYTAEERARRQVLETKLRGIERSELESHLPRGLTEQQKEEVLGQIGAIDANVQRRAKIVSDLEAQTANIDRASAGALVLSQQQGAIAQHGLEKSRADLSKTAKKLRKGKGGRAEPLVFDDIYDEQAAEFAPQFERLGRAVGATEQAQQKAIDAAAESLRGGASAGVARQAGLGVLSSLSGRQIGESQDRILSEILGDSAAPGVSLAEITKGYEPQVITSNVTNNFTIANHFDIDGAGDPSGVAQSVADAFEDLFDNKLQQASKFVRVQFRD